MKIDVAAVEVEIFSDACSDIDGSAVQRFGLDTAQAPVETHRLPGFSVLVPHVQFEVPFSHGSGLWQNLELGYFPYGSAVAKCFKFVMTKKEINFLIKV